MGHGLRGAIKWIPGRRASLVKRTWRGRRAGRPDLLDAARRALETLGAVGRGTRSLVRARVRSSPEPSPASLCSERSITIQMLRHDVGCIDRPLPRLAVEPPIKPGTAPLVYRCCNLVSQILCHLVLEDPSSPPFSSSPTGPHSTFPQRDTHRTCSGMQVTQNRNAVALHSSSLPPTPRLDQASAHHPPP